MRFIQAQARLMLSPDLRAATSQIAHIAQHDAHAGFRRGPRPSDPRGLGAVLVDISSFGALAAAERWGGWPRGPHPAALQNSPGIWTDLC